MPIGANYKLPLSLSLSETKELINFTKSNYLNKDFFNSNGDNRQFCRVLEKEVPIKPLTLSIRERFMTEMDLLDWQEEPQFGIFIGVNTKGGFVHEHKDSAPEGYVHLRLNVLLQKPFNGGMPIIQGDTLIVEEGESWINIANYWNHASTPVVGDRERIVLSVGSLLPKTNEYISRVL